MTKLSDETARELIDFYSKMLSCLSEQYDAINKSVFLSQAKSHLKKAKAELEG